jgi:integrase
MWSPRFECVVGEDGEQSYRVGHELVDEFLEFIAARARPNTVKAYAHDLKIFFTVVAKEPAEVTSRDVLGFVTQQRRGSAGAENVVRITNGSAGLSAATIKRRLAAVSALYGYLMVRGDAGVSANPVPRGLPTRQRRRNGPKVVPLVRGVRRLPRILGPVPHGPNPAPVASRWGVRRASTKASAPLGLVHKEAGRGGRVELDLRRVSRTRRAPRGTGEHRPTGDGAGGRCGGRSSRG